MADLKNDLVRLTGEINALNETIRRIVNEGGNGGLLRRYENPNTTGDTAWNGSRKKLRDEEERHAAALQGKTIPPKTMGPPAGHPGHRRTFGGPATHHGTPLCVVCGTVCSVVPLLASFIIRWRPLWARCRGRADPARIARHEAVCARPEPKARGRRVRLCHLAA